MLDLALAFSGFLLVFFYLLLQLIESHVDGGVHVVYFFLANNIDDTFSTTFISAI